MLLVDLECGVFDFELMFHILSLSSKNLTFSGVIKVLKAPIDWGSPIIETF